MSSCEVEACTVLLPKVRFLVALKAQDPVPFVQNTELGQVLQKQLLSLGVYGVLHPLLRSGSSQRQHLGRHPATPPPQGPPERPVRAQPRHRGSPTAAAGTACQAGGHRVPLPASAAPGARGVAARQDGRPQAPFGQVPAETAGSGRGAPAAVPGAAGEVAAPRCSGAQRGAGPLRRSHGGAQPRSSPPGSRRSDAPAGAGRAGGSPAPPRGRAGGGAAGAAPEGPRGAGRGWGELQ